MKEKFLYRVSITDQMKSEGMVFSREENIVASSLDEAVSMAMELKHILADQHITEVKFLTRCHVKEEGR